MAGINFGLLGDNAFESYQKFQNADTQKQLSQQQLAQAQQATRLGAAQEAKLAADAKHQKTLAAVTQIASFNTRAAALADLEARRASGELDEPTYARISSKLPADDSGMSKWQLDTLRGLLPAADQYAALKSEGARARINQQFGMGEPTPTPTSAIPNNLAPLQPANINELNNKTLPAAIPTTPVKTPTMPSPEQAAYMSSSDDKHEAEAGQRALAYWNSQPEFLKLAAERDRLLSGGATNNDPVIRNINDRIKHLSTSTPLVSVNTGQKLELAESVKKGEFNVGEYADIAKANSVNKKLLPALDVLERILNKGFETGFGTDTKVAGARLLSLFGVPEATNFVGDADTFKAMLAQTVLQRQLEQKGVTTEGDAKRIEDTYAKSNTPVDANKFIIALARATIQRDQEHKKFYDAWWSKNKTYEGASTAWDEGPANKSIFTYPALKTYAPKGNASAVAPSAPVNAKGWALHTDANGNRAYVSPDGKSFEEVK